MRQLLQEVCLLNKRLRCTALITETCLDRGHSDDGYFIEGIKYFSDITIESAVTYNVEVNDEVQHLRAEQMAISSIGLNETEMKEAAAVSVCC
jgi:hypothetical protein